MSAISWHLYDPTSGSFKGYCFQKTSWERRVFEEKPLICYPLTSANSKARLAGCKDHRDHSSGQWEIIPFAAKSQFNLTTDYRCTFIWREVEIRDILATVQQIDFMAAEVWLSGRIFFWNIAHPCMCMKETTWLVCCYRYGLVALCSNFQRGTWPRFYFIGLQRATRQSLSYLEYSLDRMTNQTLVLRSISGTLLKPSKAWKSRCLTTELIAIERINRRIFNMISQVDACISARRIYSPGIFFFDSVNTISCFPNPMIQCYS